MLDMLSKFDFDVFHQELIPKDTLLRLREDYVPLDDKVKFDFNIQKVSTSSTAS